MESRAGAFAGVVAWKNFKLVVKKRAVNLVVHSPVYKCSTQVVYTIQENQCLDQKHFTQIYNPTMK